MVATTLPAQTQTPRWLPMLGGIAALILGALMLTAPGETSVVVIQCLGLYWLVAGIFSIVSIFLDRTSWGWKLLGGMLGIMAGILIVQHPLWSTVLVPTILIAVIGMLGMGLGIAGVIQGISSKSWGAGILGGLSVLFGLALLFNPLAGVVALPFLLGFMAILGGIGSIVAALRM